ncbi:MAG: RNA polymerase subunit sigma [Planctomycetales bacterium]|nr:RNA polymerase subunit sigma [Planctomycetales bacterium]
MTDVTEILARIDQGDTDAAERLLPLVYEELRRLAAQKMAGERPDHTLQATALVHEAYARLVGSASNPGWRDRGHFFLAAADAMRKILIESARRRQSLKRGGDRQRVPLDSLVLGPEFPVDDILDLDAALERFEQEDPEAAQLVRLRLFAGLSVEEAAQSLGIATRSAYRDWSFAQAWLFRALRGGES